MSNRQKNTRRVALIIAASEGAGDLAPVIARNVASLSAVLKKSGYEIFVCPDPVRDEIVINFLSAVFGLSGSGDTIVSYLTGHGFGAEPNGQLLLILGGYNDTTAQGMALAAQTLFLGHDVKYFADASGNLFDGIFGFFDACRKLPEDRMRATINAAAIKQRQTLPVDSPFIFVLSCERSEVSNFDAGGLSHFTAALVDVIDPNHPATSIEDVLTYGQPIVTSLAKKHRHEPQNITIVNEFKAKDFGLFTLPIFDSHHAPGSIQTGSTSPKTAVESSIVSTSAPSYPFKDINIVLPDGTTGCLRFFFPAHLIHIYDAEFLNELRDRKLSELLQWIQKHITD